MALLRGSRYVVAMRIDFDTAAATLSRLRWSVGETALRYGQAILWQVDARRGVHTIIARAPSHSEAWALAAKQAESLGNSKR